MKIVLITRDRPELTRQTIETIKANAADWSKHILVVVWDGPEEELPYFGYFCTGKQLGVGGAKNFGVKTHEAFEQLQPDDLLMFTDNDMYYLKDWDSKLEAAVASATQLGGWKHPYHEGITFTTMAPTSGIGPHIDLQKVDAVTGNCFIIKYSDWLKYGPFDANAIGPGQSEDYALSQKIKAGGGVVATLDPPVAIHCGLRNSVGEPAVGWLEMAIMAEKQIRDNKIEDIYLEVPDEGCVRIRPVKEKSIEEATGLQSNYKERMPGVDGSDSELRLWKSECVSSGIQDEKSDDAGPQSNGMDSGELKRERFSTDSALLRQQTLHTTGPSNSGNSDRQYTRYAQERPRESQTITDASKTDQKRLQEWKLLTERLGSDVGSVCRADTINLIQQKLGFSGVNLGSGQRRFDNRFGWFNLDHCSRPPDQVPDVVCDGTELVARFGPASQDMVVLHHVLEHFGCGEADEVLRQCWNVLRPGGSLLIFVPDLQKLAGRFLSGEINDFTFMVNTYGAYMGNDGDRHKWGYSRNSLYQYVRDTLGIWPRDFDWRIIPGADIARDWWVLGVEVVK